MRKSHILKSQEVKNRFVDQVELYAIQAAPAGEGGGNWVPLPRAIAVWVVRSVLERAPLEDSESGEKPVRSKAVRCETSVLIVWGLQSSLQIHAIMAGWDVLRWERSSKRLRSMHQRDGC